VTIKLLDGDENGSVIAETTVHNGALPEENYPWTPFAVEGPDVPAHQACDDD